MSDDIPPEREVKDFYFKTQGKVRVNPSPGSLQTSRSSLLAVSNKYGLIFTGTSEGFKVLRQADLSQKLQEVDKVAAVVEDFPYWVTVPLGQAPTHLAVSADDLTLAVCIVKSGCPFALMYDLRAFANKDVGVAPFLEVRLSATGGAEVVDLAWNPGAEFAAIFASCTSDGSLNLWEVGEGLRVVASLPPTTGAQALCWSPKGKQLVVGKKNGSLMQYDQQLKPKKEIPCPPDFTPGSMSVVDLFWQSTHVFVAVYGLASGDMSEPPNVVVVNVPKGENPNYLKFGDICYGSGEDRKHKYYMTQIVEWDMICLASGNALEASVMGRHREQKTMWERWSLEDAGRAEMPLTEDYDETMPSGMALSLTSQTQILLGENNLHPPSPLFLMLSTDGLLISFHMIITRPGLPLLTRPPEALSAAGARAPKAGLIPAQPAQGVPPATPAYSTASVAKALFQPAQAGGSAPAPAVGATTKPSIFSSLSLGQNTSTPAKGFTFGAAPPAQTTAPQPVAVAPKPASVAPAQPSVGSTVPSLFGMKTTSAPPFSFNKALDQSAPASQAAPALAAGLGFTPAGGQGQAQLGSMPFGISARPAASLAVPQGSGAPPTAASPKPGGPLFEALSTGTTGDRPQAFSFKPAATPSVSAAPVSVVKPSPTPPVMSTAAPQQPAAALPAHPAAMVKTAPPPAALPISAAGVPKTSSAFSASQSAAGAKRSQMPTTAPTPQQPAAVIQQQQTSPQARPTLKPQTRRNLETPANTVDNPFVKSILDEMMHFNAEVKELFTRCKSVNTLDVGSDQDKQQLRAGTEQMVSFCSEIKDTMQSLNSDVTHLKSQSLEGFALLEECQIRERQGTEPAYQQLLRSRALDPASACLMKTIHSQYHYLDSSIRGVDLRLDAEWEEYQRTKNKARVIRTPATDALYQTLRNNNNVLNSQSHAIDRLVGDLQEMRLYNTTSSWQASPTIHPLNDRGDGSLADRLLTPSPAVPQPSPVMASPISPEKQARLREVLSKRRVTPVKSSAPGNLSMSKIVSASGLRRMLAGDDEDISQTPPATPPRLSAAPPKTVQVSPQPQQMMAAPAKSPGGMKPSSVTPGLVSLLQSPNSAMKPISKPTTNVIATKPTAISANTTKPLPSGITSTKPTPTPNTTLPTEGGKPNLASMGFSALALPGGINMSQPPPPFPGSGMAGSRVKVTQERPSDPAAKVISQNAGPSAFPSATSDAGTFGSGGFGFPAAGAASSTSGSTQASPFGFMKPSPTSFSFNAASGATAQKPTQSFPFSGASSAPAVAPPSSTGATVRFAAPPATTPANAQASASSSLATFGSASSATIGSLSSATIASSVDSAEVPPLLEAGYVFSSETEEWEIITKVSVELSEGAGYDEVTPPGSPAQTDFTVKPRDANSAGAEAGAGDKGTQPGLFSFNQAAKEAATSKPGGLFSGAATVSGGQKTDAPSTAKTILGGSLPSLGSGSGFTFGAAAGSTPSVQAPQKKDGEAAPSAGSASSGGLFGSATASKSGFTFGAPTSSGGAGTFTFGGAGTAAPTSTTFGGAASTGKPLFGTATTSATATAAPTFGATVVSGAGSASSAAPNVPSSSWKPIVSANSSITGSLTSGTPVFGSAAAASSASIAGTTAPPAAPSIAAAADTTATQSTIPQPGDGAASEGVAEKPAAPAPATSTPSAAKQLFGQAAEPAPAPASPAPSVVKSLFGQPATTSTSAFGAAGLGLKPATSISATTAAAATSAEGASQPAAVSAPVSVGSAGGAAAVAASTAAGTTITAATTTSTLFGKPTAGTFGNVAGSTASASSTTTTTTTTSTTPSIFGQQVTPSTTASTGLFSSTSSIFGNKPAATSAASEVPASSAQKSLFGNTQSTAATSAPLFAGSQPATTVASAGSGIFGNTQSVPASSSSSVFGQSAVFGGTPASTSTAPAFGGAATSTSAPAFGSQSTTTTSGFGFAQSSAPGFGGAAFGQKPTPVFGGQPAQPLFGGQTTTTTASSSVFGQPAVPSSGSGAFSGGSGGGGGFFSGLGGKPSAENASKNVFGTTTFGTAASAGGASTGLFGASSSTAGGSSFGGGAFSGTTTQGGSVAASGFGGFSSPQQASPQRGGFGGAPAFGGSPGFGSPPAFGGTPGFGAGAAFSNPMGQPPAAAPSAGGFASFAGSAAPTFGGIAQQTAPSFGDMSQQGGAATFGSPQPGFGSPAPASGLFGAGAGGNAPAFGGSSFGASPSFGGGPSSPSFTSYRS